jgi:hypothetical protein
MKNAVNEYTWLFLGIIVASFWWAFGLNVRGPLFDGYELMLIGGTVFSTVAFMLTLVFSGKQLRNLFWTLIGGIVSSLFWFMCVAYNDGNFLLAQALSGVAFLAISPILVKLSVEAFSRND